MGRAAILVLNTGSSSLKFKVFELEAGDALRAIAGGQFDALTTAPSLTARAGGRIVAGLGHVHGGAKDLTLSRPGCGGRVLYHSRPTWGLPDHPFYRVRPVLHEPGPINMSQIKTETGIPVAAGERIRLREVTNDDLAELRITRSDRTIDIGECHHRASPKARARYRKPAARSPRAARFPQSGITSVSA